MRRPLGPERWCLEVVVGVLWSWVIVSIWLGLWAHSVGGWKWLWVFCGRGCFVVLGDYFFMGRHLCPESWMVVVVACHKSIETS